MSSVFVLFFSSSQVVLNWQSVASAPLCDLIILMAQHFSFLDKCTYLALQSSSDWRCRSDNLTPALSSVLQSTFSDEITPVCK